MLKVNDVIVYGSEGVCRITGIEDKVLEKTRKTYYVLKPVIGGSSTVIYIPTDNQKLLKRIRMVSSKENVLALIDSLPEMTPNWIQNERDRKAAFRSILENGDHTALIMMLKAIYLEKKDREESKKQIRMTDAYFMKEAEQLLYSEWQYVLGMSREELEHYIFKRMEERPACKHA